jgi:hypothetical protein
VQLQDEGFHCGGVHCWLAGLGGGAGKTRKKQQAS